MSGIGFFELVILFMIGLVVLGPKRLPKVANQLGTWVGQARRMTRVMKRQLEEELDLSVDLKDLKSIGEGLKEDLTVSPASVKVPRDDDTYSPLHEKPAPSVAGIEINSDEVSVSTEDETDAVPPDDGSPDDDVRGDELPDERSPDERQA